MPWVWVWVCVDVGGREGGKEGLSSCHVCVLVGRERKSGERKRDERKRPSFPLDDENEVDGCVRR